MHIMDYMSGRVTALLGVVGVAALGIYIKARWSRRAPSDELGPKRSVPVASAGRVEIDDDAAAEIIKRARPELERARESYAV
jgi:hypothetical protein